MAPIGMWGISYGGFTAIQVAALRPPHLRAIVPVMATDDRYLDDVHYRGGCVTVSELSQYAVSQVAMNAMPPEAAFRGAAWRDEWLARLDATPPWLFAWLRHQTDGPYWRQGSLAPDYDAIEAAIFNIGGWQDSYVDPAFRMQARCPAPSHTLVGNWVPLVAARCRRRARTSTSCTRSPGSSTDTCAGPTTAGTPSHRSSGSSASTRRRRRSRRISRAGGARRRAYPHPETVVRPLFFGGGRCPAGRAARPAGGADGGRRRGIDTFAHRPTAGTRGPLSWGAGGAPNGLARDLRRDEDAGPTYTSDPLDRPLEILGVPEVVVHLEVDAPVATALGAPVRRRARRDVALVSAGVLNLTHRRSHGGPGAAAARRRRGDPACRSGPPAIGGCRVTGSGSRSPRRCWPVLWPSPYPATFRVHRGPATPSRLDLPVSRPPAVRATRPCRRSGRSRRTCTGRPRSPSTAPARP